MKKRESKILLVVNRLGEKFKLGDGAYFPLDYDTKLRIRIKRKRKILEFKQSISTIDPFMDFSFAIMARFDTRSWTNIDSITKKKKKPKKSTDPLIRKIEKGWKKR